MARCEHCNDEDASLYESGLLICLKCVALQEAKTKKNQASIHDILVCQLSLATLEAESAAKEFNAITGDVPGFLPQPDGTQRILNASRTLSAARSEMIKAHTRLRATWSAGLYRKT